MTTSLTWNGITICNPSDGLSGYGAVDIKGSSQAYEDVTFRGQSGRFLRALGHSLSDETSRAVSFQGLIYSSGAGDIMNLLTSMESKMTDPSNASGTLQFAVPFTGNTNSWSNMVCRSFAPKAIAFLEVPTQQLPGYTGWFSGFEVSFVEVYQ